MSCRRATLWWAIVMVAMLAAWPAPVSAQVEDWEITRFDVTIEVTEGGDLLVDETIELDFGSLEKHGIFRYIPVWEDLPTPLPPELADAVPEGRDADEFQRVIEIDQLRVESSSGAPTDVDISGPANNDGNMMIRIGDPEVSISGAQQYRISYRARGAFDHLDDGYGLAWDAVGTGWPVPIQQATAELIAPGVESARCLQGRQGTVEPCEADTTDQGARFTATRPLRPYEGMTLAAEISRGAIEEPPILVDERPSLRRFLVGSRAAIPLAVLTLLAGGGLLAWLGWRQGRDRLARGSVTSHGQIDDRSAEARRRGLFEGRAVPVEFRPPDGLRPGQLGLIVDERVDAVDVTATLVDLAVRGYLRIEEVEGGGWFRKGDWCLVQTEPPADDQLLGYEQILLNGLFEDGDEVLVSDLKGTFAPTYQKVETGIYADGQSRRWFADRPDSTRSRWLGAGLALTVLGALATVGLGMAARMAVVGLAVVVLGIALMAMHGKMPSRTSRGSAMLTRTLGFREFIDQAEADRMEFAEAENLFVDYLPYAVVFGAVDKWAHVFESLGVDVGRAVSGFYVGPGPFHLMAFSAGMNDFSSSVGTAVTTAPPSSGSGGFSGGGFGGGGGFSGGGFGGGGGGSW